jgi:hypothetical protein
MNRNETPIIGSFETLDAAEAARANLLASGLAPERVELRILADEAGGTSGNFVVGNGHSAGSSVISIDGVATYPENFATVRTAGHCLVLVAPQDESERTHVVTLLGAALVPNP